MGDSDKSKGTNQSANKGQEAGNHGNRLFVPKDPKTGPYVDVVVKKLDKVADEIILHSQSIEVLIKNEDRVAKVGVALGRLEEKLEVLGGLIGEYQNLLTPETQPNVSKHFEELFRRASEVAKSGHIYMDKPPQKPPPSPSLEVSDEEEEENLASSSKTASTSKSGNLESDRLSVNETVASLRNSIENKKLEIELREKEREKRLLETKQKQFLELQQNAHEIQRIRDQLELSQLDENLGSSEVSKRVSFLPTASEHDSQAAQNFHPPVTPPRRDIGRNPFNSSSLWNNDLSSIWSQPELGKSTPAPIGSDFGNFLPSTTPSHSSLDRCLPKFKLSQFNGDPLEWPEWSGLFQATVGKSSISKDEKMNHLKSLLTGKARDSVSGLGFSGTMYDVAWKTLESHFGKPHLIVGSQLAKLQQFPNIKIHDSAAIMSYATVVSNFVNILTQFQYNSDLMSSTNLRIALQKLPNNLKEQWLIHSQEISLGSPTLVEFNDWLQGRARVHSDLVSATEMRSTAPKAYGPTNKQGSFLTTTTKSDKLVKSCPHCEDKHPLWACKSFKDLNVEKRFQVVKEKKLCYLCLRSDHGVKDCKLEKCGKYGCEKKHNRLLHREVKGSPAIKETTDKQENQTFASNKGKSGILHLVPVKIESNGDIKETLALCDTGSTISWIDETLVNDAMKTESKQKFTVTGINGDAEMETQMVKMSLTAVADSSCPTYDISAAVHPNLNLGSGTYDIWDLKRLYPHLSRVPSSIQRLCDVKMILGQDNFSLIRPLAYKDGGRDEPWAIKTVFGWSVGGPLPKRVVTKLSSMLTAAYDPIAEQLKSWWDIEAYGSKVKIDNRSSDDKRALATLEETTRKKDGRYEVGLLWAKDDVEMPNNYTSAASQMYSLERRLDKDEDLKEAYKKTIKSDEENGYVRKLDHSELNATRNEGQWYLPHHPVINPNKPGKVRRVCNAASVYQGKSLNSELLIGPDLLQNLIGILFRFREFRIALSADIEAMFLQVKVPEADARYLRFLWRDSSDEQLRVWEYTRHIFGAKSSPTCANYALIQTSKDNQSQYPVAAVSVRKNFYMDDCLSGGRNVTEAFNLSIQLKNMLANGGFTLRKWLSNSSKLMEMLPKDDIDEKKVKEVKSDQVKSTVLGLEWFPENDVLKLCRGLQKTIPEKVTQRVVLSFVSSLFDPLGLAAPFSIKIRLLLKRIWQTHGQQWDEELSIEDCEEFKQWHKDLPIINDLQLERYYLDGESESLELHVFADASQDAMGVVAYLKASNADGQSFLRFIIGKSRVAPMRHLTIPKLELQAAVIATRIKDSIEKEHETNFDKVYMWTDSTTVIQWINSSFKKQPVFVANRVAEILESTTVDQWNHIPGKDNPADIGTRGIGAQELLESAWLTGPAWLEKSTEEWPVTKVTPSDQSCEDISMVIKEVEHLIDWGRFSKWSKLRSTMRYVLKLVKPKRDDFNIVDDLDTAEKKIFALVQKESFTDETARLMTEQHVSNKSRIASLAPFVDVNGILRAQGRLRKANIEYAAKHPIVLTAHHPAVKLYLCYLHDRWKHEGVEFIRSQVQQEFWIIGLRNALRRIKQQCVQCRRRAAKVIEPMMADLPSSRLADRLFPFTYCGVDYFGPFETKQNRKSNKRWCFLFTCMTTRAVHLEMVSSLDTDSCINGIMRFIARKGKPKVIISDNGTNFVGAAKEIKRYVNQWNAENIEEKLAQEAIKWRFNPPAAPHFGGSWERLVQSCKKAMFNILHGMRLTDEILATTLCTVEQILNSRPLTPASSDPKDLEALTPYHFLLGRPNVSVPYIPSASAYISNRKAFRVSQAVADKIWQRWLKEYIPLYNERAKWRTSGSRQLRVDDLVWLIDTNSKRGDYRLARVIETYMGDDGIIRSAKVRTSNGELTRPVIKLSPVLEECVPLFKEHRAGDVEAMLD